MHWARAVKGHIITCIYRDFVVFDVHMRHSETTIVCDSSLALAVVRAGKVYTVATATCETHAFPPAVQLQPTSHMFTHLGACAAAGWHQSGAISSMAGTSHARGRREHERHPLSYISSVRRKVRRRCLSSPWAERWSRQVYLYPVAWVPTSFIFGRGTEPYCNLTAHGDRYAGCTF